MPIVVKIGVCQCDYFQEKEGLNYPVKFGFDEELERKWKACQGQQVNAHLDFVAEWATPTLVFFTLVKNDIQR